jgi:hypothetical protein
VRGDNAFNHKQLINVHGKDVDGVDIAITALKLSVQFKHPLGIITLAHTVDKALRSERVKVKVNQFRSPNTNAFVERFVQSIQ